MLGVESNRSALMRKRFAESARAFSATARNPSLLRAQLAFGASWTAEWAFMVALGVIAFRDGGATAVGVVAFARMAPSFCSRRSGRLWPTASGATACWSGHA